MTARRPHVAVYLREADHELDDCLEQCVRCLHALAAHLDGVDVQSLKLCSDYSAGLIAGESLREGILAGITSGTIDLVVVDRLDRLAQSATLLQEVLDTLDRHGARLLCADGTRVGPMSIAEMGA